MVPSLESGKTEKINVEVECGRQADRQTDRQTNTDRQTDRKTDRKADSDSQSNRAIINMLTDHHNARGIDSFRT